MKCLSRKMILTLLFSAGLGTSAFAAGYEVWSIDQADQEVGGAKLYIYEGSIIEGSCMMKPEVVDLDAMGGGVRPHMVLFNAANTHALISHVGSDNLYILDTNNRSLVADLKQKAHAAMATPDDRYIIAADVASKTVYRFTADFSKNQYALKDKLPLAPFEEKTGGVAKPICPAITEDSKYSYMTLAGGGLLVIDIQADSMSIVDVYAKSEIAANGCGGLLSPDKKKMYINSAPTDPKVADHLYIFDTTKIGSRPMPKDIVLPGNDNHGMFLSQDGRYLWTVNRDSNDLVIVDTKSETVLKTIAVSLSDQPELDAAPDIADIAPNGNMAFINFRGPKPLTANNEEINNAVGSSPGVGVFRIDAGGASGELACIAPIRAKTVEGVEQADPHGLKVRKK
jgi:YVTN family beta-propeller protein